MFKHSTSTLALSVALLLIYSVIFQSFPTSRGGLVLANTAAVTPTEANAPGAAPSDQLKSSSATGVPSGTPAPNAPTAAAITATLTDNVAPATKVAPGGTINYTAVISNTNLISPADDAGSLVYNGTLDANTTLSGLVSVSPIGFNDTYPQTVIGNVSINSANIPYSVVTNDYQGQNGGPLSISAFDAATTAGGQIVMTTSGVDIGKFTYNPPPGFEGTDTFTYTLTNTAGSSVGTVSIPVSGMVWFINNNAAACTTLAGGCGRLSNPFSTLAAFQALNNGTGNNPAINDNIFVFESATTYTGGVTLLNGQRFIGQDSSNTLASITGLTPPSGSTAFPAMNTGAPATTITNGAGNGITLNALGGTNTVRGMTITNTSSAKISGSTFGTLTAGNNTTPDLVLSGTGQALNLTTGTFAATSAFTSVAATSSATTGVSLTTVGGTVSFGSTSTASTTGQGISVNTSSVSINFGNTSVTTSGGTGVSLTTNTGPLTFADLDISPNGGQRGLFAQNNTATITSTSGTISTSTGIAVEITGTSSASRTPLDMTLTSVSVNGATNGIILTNTNGPAAAVGFVVIGDGSNTAVGGNATGGTIQNTAGGDSAAPATAQGIGIRLNFADEVVIRRMTLTTQSNFGIYGANSSNFTFEFATINGNNGTASGVGVGAGDASVAFDELTGAALVKDSIIQGTIEDQFRVVNTTGTLNRLTFTNDTFGTMDAALGDDALNIQGLGNAVVNLTVQDSDLNFARGDILGFTLGNTAGTTASGDLVFNNNVVNNQIALPVLGGGGISLVGGGASNAVNTLTYDITNSSFRGARGDALLILWQTGAGSTNGNILNNTFGVNGVAGSCSTEATCIEIRTEGRGGHTTLINNNQIHNYFQWGIYFEFDGINVAGSTGTIGGLNATVSNNTIDQPALPPTGTQNGVHVNFGASSGDTYQGCADILNNSAATSGGTDTIIGTDYILRQRAATTIRLPGYAGATNDNAAVVAYITGRNTGADTAAAFNTVGGAFPNTGGGFTGGAICTQPSLIARRGDDLALMQSPGARPVQTLGAAVAPIQTLPATVAAALPAATSPVVASAVANVNDQSSDANGARRSHHAQFKRSQTVKANAIDKGPLGPTSGEAVGPVNIGTLPAGKSVTIKYAATVNTPPLARQVSHQGSVTFTNGAGSPLLTDDTDLPGGAADPTVTLIDTTTTWTGVTSTDWNVSTNWLQGFVPISVSDVVIPNAGVTSEPNIITPDVNVFTLDLQSARTLTINTGRTLTVNGGLTTLAGALAGTGYNLNFVGLTLNRAGGITLGGPTSVSGVLTLTSGIHTVTSPSTLTVGGTGTIVRTAGYIIGNLNKVFSAPGAFVFHVGTANNYSPVSTTVTAGAGNLTVLAVQGPRNPPLDPTKALARYWTLTEGGAITANLVFTYNQTDVVGNEAQYRVTRVIGNSAVTFKNVAPCPGAGTPCVDTTANTATINGVSNFSDWTVAEPAIPTASGGVVTGRIVADDGTPVEGAVVRLSGAQNRKFITDANGFYRFENVETNGFYNVTPSRVNYTFSPAVISFSQIGESTEAAFGASATGATANPLDTPEYFVRQHYLDFLGREPDEAGFNFWSDQIIGCGDDTDCVDRKKQNVSAAYFYSIEFQETGGLVDRAYRIGYGVRPTYAEFKADGATVAPGLVVGSDGWEVTMENGKAAFIEAFVQRPAFHAAFDGMSNDAYVDALIANTGVSFTSAERSGLVSGLAGGGMTRATVLRAIAENELVVAAKRNQAFVMMEYFGYLRREPDADGYQFWLNKLNEFNGNFERAEMVRSFIVSGEYRARFPR